MQDFKHHQKVLAAFDIQIAPLTNSIGAEILGIDLSQPLSKADYVLVNDTFLKYHVIFFRDQTLTPADLRSFAACFGELWRHPYIQGLPEEPDVMVIRKEADDEHNFAGAWHTDTSYQVSPCMGSMLYALEVPAAGGDTLFADLTLACEQLSTPLRDFLSQFNAAHSYYGASDYGRDQEKDTTYEAQSGEKLQRVTHPVISTHPETGATSIYVNSMFTEYIEGLSPTESDTLLQYLYQHSVRPEFTCRFRWRQGSLAFWDNRCTLHYPLNDYAGQRREMHRVAIRGAIIPPARSETGSTG